MAGIRGKNTKPELLLRRALHANGFRYRLHDSRLPGKPDLVFPMYKAVVFIHGCFWHRHPDCWWNKAPSSNAAFWEDKLGRNVERDARTVEELRERGWRVAVVWECSFRLSDALTVAEAVGEWLLNDISTLTIPIQIRSRPRPDEEGND